MLSSTPVRSRCFGGSAREFFFRWSDGAGDTGEASPSADFLRPASRQQHRRRVDIDDRLQILAIAAAADDGHRRGGIAGRRQHHPVSLEQSGLGQTEPAKPIAFIGVGTGDVEHKVGPGPGERFGQRRLESPQVVVIPRAVLEADVERTGLFPKREVAGAVDRHREVGRIDGKNLRRAIPLMHVAVEDQHSRDDTPGLHLPGRHGRVVEHAIALAPVATGVVRAAGETSGNAILEGRGRRIDGGASAPERPLDQFAAPRETDPSHLVPRKRARHHAAEIVPRVHAEQFIVCRGMRFDEFKRRPGHRVLFQPPPQERVFIDRKPVPVRKRETIPVARKESHGHRF